MTDLCFLPAADLVHLLRAGEVTSVELLDRFLARVERYGPAINAVVALVATGPGPPHLGDAPAG